MRGIDWVVYAKKPFGRPAQALAYLDRYTHRVAIANSRVAAIEDDHFAFAWKIIARTGACKIMKLVPDEFIRRFLLHTLPDGFHRIRHFGFMANGCRAAKLALCRSALLERIKCAETATDETAASQANVNPSACPECGGVMRIVATLLRAADRGSQTVQYPGAMRRGGR